MAAGTPDRAACTSKHHDLRPVGAAACQAPTCRPPGRLSRRPHRPHRDNQAQNAPRRGRWSMKRFDTVTKRIGARRSARHALFALGEHGFPITRFFRFKSPPTLGTCPTRMTAPPRFCQRRTAFWQGPERRERSAAYTFWRMTRRNDRLSSSRCTVPQVLPRSHGLASSTECNHVAGLPPPSAAYSY